jgi:mannose-6-phosphate isomerase-like protein (cupin superfamily)
MRMLMSVIVVASALVHAGAAPVDYGPVVHWSADDLKAGRASQLPLQTPTHRFTLVRRTNGQSAQAESHAGATDIFFVIAGRGRITAGGAIDQPTMLAGMPGEIRGPSITGGRQYGLDPGALISLPPSTAYKLEPDASGLTLVRLTINVGMHPWSIVQTQQTTLATANPNRPPVTIPTSLGQGEVQHWPADLLQRAHQVLAAASASGKPTNDPRDLVNIPMARTHAWNFLYRRIGANGQPPAVEFHEGTYDIYFIVAGSGTVMTGGTIENRRKVADRPGEDQGTLITGGRPLRVKAGDVINMPPSTPHQSVPDAAGFSYMLVKVNTGTYPWSLIAEEPPQ